MGNQETTIAPQENQPVEEVEKSEIANLNESKSQDKTGKIFIYF